MEPVTETKLSLPDLYDEFDQWRKNRKCKGRIPEYLIKKAVILTKQHGISKVAKYLHLGHNDLKKYCDKVNQSCVERTDFLEINSVPLFLPDTTNPSVILERTDGNKMHLPLSLAAQSLPQLLHSFWGDN